jgi:predicted secreted protein
MPNTRRSRKGRKSRTHRKSVKGGSNIANNFETHTRSIIQYAQQRGNSLNFSKGENKTKLNDYKGQYRTFLTGVKNTPIEVGAAATTAATAAWSSIEIFYRVSITILSSAITAYDTDPDGITKIWNTHDTTIHLYWIFTNELIDKLRVSSPYDKSVTLNLVTNKFTEVMDILNIKPKDAKWREMIDKELDKTNGELETYKTIFLKRDSPR